MSKQEVAEIEIPSVNDVVEFWQKFYKDSLFFATKCKKPDRREFMAMAQACVMGFSVMGFVGCLTKLFFIPVNKFLIG
jgi:protein transport protein SEC61 subunit gamma and related proteins